MTADLGIPANRLETIGLLLNTLLADEYVLFTKTKYYHWNVEAPNFHELHRFFDEQAELLEDVIDEVAERTRALGHYTAGSLKDFLFLTRLLETKDDDGEASRMVKHLLNDHETLIRTLRRDVALTAEYGDAGTSDFLTGLLEKHEKMAWMLRAFLPRERRQLPLPGTAANVLENGR